MLGIVLIHDNVILNTMNNVDFGCSNLRDLFILPFASSQCFDNE